MIIRIEACREPTTLVGSHPDDDLMDVIGGRDDVFKTLFRSEKELVMILFNVTGP